MRVLIVVDDPLFRLGVAAALVGGDRLEFILSEAGDGGAAFGTPDLPRRVNDSLCVVTAHLEISSKPVPFAAPV
jgi:hypothetical protein